MQKDPGYLLVVEDDRDIQELLETSLTIKHYRVIAAHDGRHALKIVEWEHPRLVIADIMMPHLDGYGLAHRLRLNPETRDIPVVFITATYVPPEDRDFAFSIGVEQIIQKPINMAAFLETIERLLKREARPAVDPLNEFIFYEGYRKRLQIKLDQKTVQIARDERLLADLSEADSQELRASLRRALRERNELKVLLEQVHKQLERIDGPK